MSRSRILGSFAAGLLTLSFAGCSSAPVEDEVGAEAAELAVVTSTMELVAVEDARTQLGSGDVNFGGGIILWTNVPAAHNSFVRFDLDALPVNAVVESAELVLYFNGNYENGENSTELGRVEAPWEEATITWNNQPAVTWGGPTAPVGDVAGDVAFDVTSLVDEWHRGAQPNYGFAMHSEEVGGKQYWSREAQQSQPRLVVRYTIPVEPPGPRPDLGDAPDSTNHHGLNNTAYPVPGVLGQFPTVFQVPANQPAGPRHANQTVQAFLGGFMSGETEADLGPDQDGPNNILRNAAGMLGDVADRDRGDDGWRNRGIRFFNCEQRELVVRVSRPAGATLPSMFLNVWFDGNEDGDWSDVAPCVPPSGGPAAPSFEWIVQNRPIDMTTVPSGGFRDFTVNTVRVMNLTEGHPHWMRFTLADAPAPAAGAGLGGLPDGRGPHPTVRPNGYRFGETEDVKQLPPPPPPPVELDPPTE